jgi:hypothetical protein
MKNISKEEFKGIKSSEPTKWQIIRAKLNELAVGEVLVVEMKDWDVNSLINPYISYAFKAPRSNKRMSVKALPARSGWAVLRTK